MRLSLCLLCSFLAFIVGLASVTKAQPSDWATGVDFERQLNQPTQLSWQGTPLRDALQELAEVQRTAIFLDRRVDPGQPVSFTSSRAAFETVLIELATELDLAMFTLDGLIYFGPPREVDRLMTLARIHREQLRSAELEAKRLWLQEDALSWPRLSEPRTLIDEMFGEAGVELAGREQIPHDLWDAGELPAMPLIDRALVLLGGFGYTVQLTGGDERAAVDRAAIIPVPAKPQYTDEYRVRRELSVDPDELRATYPEAQIETFKRRWRVTASAREHQQIAARLRGETQAARKVPSQEGEQRYTIRNTTTAAGNIVATVAQQLKLQISMELDVRRRLQETIEVEVENATLDELFEQSIGPLGLTYEIRGQQLIIKRK